MNETAMLDIHSDKVIDALPIAAAGAATSPPVIDLSTDPRAVSDAVAAACREWGFFLATGHGIAPGALDRTLGQARRFFALPREQRRALSRSFDSPWGYYDRELTKNARDRKEVFDIGPEEVGGGDPFGGANHWPEGDDAFRRVMTVFMAACEALADRLVRIVVTGLGECENVVADAFRPAPTSFLRLNHYPTEDPLADLAPEDSGRKDAGRAVHHHSDAGAITVLLEDGTPGLQVLHEGLWHDVIPQPGALIVNIGDMIEVWSNGLYRAPIHRVLAMTESERYSTPFFYNPSYLASIAPLPAVAQGTGAALFKPVPWAEFRRRRAEGDYGNYGREVQISDYAR